MVVKKHTTLFAAFCFYLAILATSCTKNQYAVIERQDITEKTFENSYNFIVISDWGWNGQWHQKEVAAQMAKTASKIKAKFIATCGDNFQELGVKSVRDILWITNFRNIYISPSLNIDWYPVLGNHDYRGNTQAEIDYSNVDSRWRMTERYYTFTRNVNDSISARLIFLDTPQMLDEYRDNPGVYPDASKQDDTKELKWIEEVLAGSHEQWKLVFGHNPVFSAARKHGNTQELIEKLKPLLNKYNAQLYFCGHDHTFQHLREQDETTDYIVTGTGGQTRPSNTNEMSVFSKSEPGFTVVSFKADSLKLAFVGTDGKIIYSFGRKYN
jgi:tartrate-resistant acid phosphatase type 5